MSPHLEGCQRAKWLLQQPKKGLFWAVFLQEGPPCSCGRAEASVQR